MPSEEEMPLSLVRQDFANVRAADRTVHGRAAQSHMASHFLPKVDIRGIFYSQKQAAKCMLQYESQHKVAKKLQGLISPLKSLCIPLLA